MYSFSEICRQGKIELIIGFEAERGGEKIGNIKSIIRDKYGRLSGLEILIGNLPENRLAAVPYNNLIGIDLDAKKVRLAI